MVLAVVLLVFIMSSIGGIFWYQAWIYSLPTELPASYKAVDRGTLIRLEKHVLVEKGKPVFIHFFNPDCPCSRFNLKEFKSIASNRTSEASFVVVVLSPEKIKAEEIKKQFHLDMPVIMDTALAKECGVYSTPQAVILDSDSRLHYRGNYNRSRYCTDKETSFALIALNQLREKHPSYVFSKTAIQAYGCSIENCVE
ncbi:TlpA family protein disulfide reductase [Arcticibacter sp.]|uniref:TlpA family protein disulfide reductase n=1 Tax=Arcticibacter sp. TaxID=1872630 RepID=UPI00388F5279